MKLIITVKDPDGVNDCLKDAGVFNDDYEIKDSNVEDAVDKFIEFKEYITIEIDTDTGEATVAPVK